MRKQTEVGIWSGNRGEGSEGRKRREERMLRRKKKQEGGRKEA